jgi:SUMO ligase MMS21 Smc5/6 complex component
MNARDFFELTGILLDLQDEMTEIMLACDDRIQKLPYIRQKIAETREKLRAEVDRVRALIQQQ